MPEPMKGQSAMSEEAPYWICWGSRGELFVVADKHRDPSSKGPYPTIEEAWAAIDGRQT